MAATVIPTRFQLRRDTAANWATKNPTPLSGEPCLETDTGLRKLGDGTTAWTSLLYQLSGPAYDASNWADGDTLIWDGANKRWNHGPGGKQYQSGNGISIANPASSTPTISSTLGSIALSGNPATYAALPTTLGTTNAGNAYLVQADGLVYIWSGTAWPAQGAGVSLLGLYPPQSPPLLVSLPTRMGSGATFSDRIHRLDAVIPATGETYVCAASIGAPPYTVDVHVKLGVATGVNASVRDAIVCGLALSDGTLMRGFYLGYWGAAGMQTMATVDSWNSVASFNAQINFVRSPQIAASDHWTRITDDGTSRTFFVSADGVRYFQWYQEATNTFVTPTLAGILVHNGSDLTSQPAKASLYHYKVTPFILGDSA